MKPEIRHPIDVARVCDGLAHEKRVMIYRILEEKGPLKKQVLLFDLTVALKEHIERTTLINHLDKMETTGILEVRKDDTIHLKKKIIIDIGDIK